MPSIFESLVAAIEQKQPVALALLNGVKGSSPQKKGAKALFFADGRMAGTLGGGCLEAEVRERARLAIETAQPSTFELVLDHVFGWDDGLICGGKVSGIILPEVRSTEQIWRRLQKRDIDFCWGIDLAFNVREVKKEEDSGGWLYQEQIRPPTALWIAGAGHVAQAVAPLALNLDFAVTVFDDRDSLANHRFFPPETHLRVDDWERMLETPLPSSPTFGLILTRGHQHDAKVLRKWIQQPFAFLGMIGSRRKRRLIFERFLEEHFATEEQLNRVQCPVGVDILAISVPEIAVSIVGQLIQKRATICQR